MSSCFNLTANDMAFLLFNFQEHELVERLFQDACGVNSTQQHKNTQMRACLSQLCQNDRASYLVQKAIQRSSDDEVVRFLQIADVSSMIRNPYGRAVIERVLKERNGMFCGHVFERVKYDLVSLATHPEANFVIQTICAGLPEEQIYEVAFLIAPDVGTVAVDTHGNFVIQRVISILAQYQPKRMRSKCIHALFCAMVQMGTSFITHRLGNYSVQRLVPSLNECQSIQLMHVICGNFLECCTSVGGAAVIRAMLVNGRASTIRKIVDTILLMDRRDLYRFCHNSRCLFIKSRVLECVDSVDEGWLKRHFACV